MPRTPRNAPESETQHEKQRQQNSELLSHVVIHACRPPYAYKELAVERYWRGRENVLVSRVVPSLGGVGSLIANAITPTGTLGDRLLRGRRMTVEVCFAERLREIVALG
jgi:hypothetical protein